MTDRCTSKRGGEVKPKFCDAALRYGSYRDREAGDIEWEYAPFWIGFALLWLALLSRWIVAATAS